MDIHSLASSHPGHILNFFRFLKHHCESVAAEENAKEDMNGSINCASLASTFSKPSPPSNYRSEFDTQYIPEMNGRDDTSSFYRFPSSFATNPPSSEAYMSNSEDVHKQEREDPKNVYGNEVFENILKNLNPQSAGTRSVQQSGNLSHSERIPSQRLVHSVPWSPMHAIGGTMLGSSSRFYFFENVGQNAQETRSDAVISSKQDFIQDCDADTCGVFYDKSPFRHNFSEQRRMEISHGGPDSSLAFNRSTTIDVAGSYHHQEPQSMLADRVHNPTAFSPSLLSRSRQSPALSSMDLGGGKAGRIPSFPSPGSLSDDLCFRGMSEEMETPFVGLSGQSLENLMFTGDSVVREEVSEAKSLHAKLDLLRMHLQESLSSTSSDQSKSGSDGDNAASVSELSEAAEERNRIVHRFDNMASPQAHRGPAALIFSSFLAELHPLGERSAAPQQEHGVYADSAFGVMASGDFLPVNQALVAHGLWWQNTQTAHGGINRMSRRA
eukprot:755178-Hanusia_phi.AAC.4